MIRYRLHQDVTSRYATMKECSEGEFVSVEDMKALIDQMMDDKMVGDQYDLLVKHGIIKDE